MFQLGPKPHILSLDTIERISQPLLLRQMLQTLNHLHGSLLDLFQYVHVLYQVVQTWIQHSRCVLPIMSRETGRIISPRLLAVSLYSCWVICP